MLDICFTELIKGRLYFSSFDGRPPLDPGSHYFNVDNEFEYEAFYQDFGPLNLAMLYRYYRKLQSKMKMHHLARKRIIYYTSTNSQKRVNGAYLIGSFMIINHGKSADEVWRLLEKAQPPKFVSFRDASLGPSTYDLTLRDVFIAVEKALKLGWLNFDTFDVEQYECYEKVENGDFNWIIPPFSSKVQANQPAKGVLAFCGPHNKDILENGYPHHSPEKYFDYFREHNITTIVRLNKKLYDASRFTSAGFQHCDLFFVDGSTPSDYIVQKFIDVCERSAGGIAVHCKAGLGRTGTLIACYMMKHYQLTAAECMAWIRICRPGSVIGPQQQFLINKQQWCFAQAALLKQQSNNAIVQSMSLPEDLKLVNGVRHEKNYEVAPKHAPGTNNNGVLHILSRVDTIKISTGSPKLLSPISSVRVAKPSKVPSSDMLNGTELKANGFLDANDNVEKRTNASSVTQGDRLMQIKASRRARLSNLSTGRSLTRVTAISADALKMKALSRVRIVNLKSTIASQASILARAKHSRQSSSVIPATSVRRITRNKAVVSSSKEGKPRVLTQTATALQPDYKSGSPRSSVYQQQSLRIGLSMATTKSASLSPQYNVTSRKSTLRSRVSRP